jgi:endonuclease-3 related protein
MSHRYLTDMYDRLYRRFGPQHWWPGQTPDEVAAGCVLAQNTRWERVVPVIERLRDRNLLSPAMLAEIREEDLAELLRGSGTHRRKFLTDRGWNGSPDSLAHLDTASIRHDLLALRGIGPETADCVLLYVLERPVFVVDTYTRRILSRHGLCDPHAGYEDLRHLFESELKPDPPLFNEYHALLVTCAKTHCRPKPACESCPLAGLPV